MLTFEQVLFYFHTLFAAASTLSSLDASFRLGTAFDSLQHHQFWYHSGNRSTLSGQDSRRLTFSSSPPPRRLHLHDPEIHISFTTLSQDNHDDTTALVRFSRMARMAFMAFFVAFCMVLGAVEAFEGMVMGGFLEVWCRVQCFTNRLGKGQDAHRFGDLLACCIISPRVCYCSNGGLCHVFLLSS